MTGWVGERILADLRMRLFEHLQHLSLGFYERNRAGVLISRLTNDVEAIDQLVTDGVTSLVQNTLTLIGTAIILFVLDWRLALATCAVIPLMIVATAVFRTRSARAYAAVRERLGLVTATLAEDIAGMRVVQAFTREQPALRELPRRRAALPRVEHADGRPERPLLPVRRPALVASRSPSCSATAATSTSAARLTLGDALRVHALRPELLRPGAAALAALQHVPLGDRGARQDHGRARRGAGGRSTGRGAEPLAQIEGHVRFEDVHFTYGRGDGGAARDRPRRPGRDDGRARRPHGRRQVDDREAARALLRADAAAGSRSTAST